MKSLELLLALTESFGCRCSSMCLVNFCTDSLKNDKDNIHEQKIHVY